MLQYQEFKLQNGLTVIAHRDPKTPLAVVNMLYKVGSRNEHPDRTGFAHLFEHLMFGGSAHVPDFDKSLQKIGAENNAFTNTDVTNYYIILGADNIETAMWVESDRMQYLNLDQKSLDVQKKVVIEEFKQRYLNVPYGEVWLKFRPLAYKAHPYRWPTIGMDISHIQEATLENVREFHETYYSPDNAVLTVSGDIDPVHIYELAQKWFGDIPATTYKRPSIPEEPKQMTAGFLEINGDAPLSAIYKGYHMPARGSNNYIAADLLSDLIGRGKSSRLYQRLVKDNNIFNSIESYVLGTSDPGLLVISGKVNPGIDILGADHLIEQEIASISEDLDDPEVEKVVNQAESAAYFSQAELLEKSINLAIANSIGNTNLVNEEIDLMRETRKQDLLSMANQILVNSNCNTLYYNSIK